MYFTNNATFSWQLRPEAFDHEDIGQIKQHIRPHVAHLAQPGLISPTTVIGLSKPPTVKSFQGDQIHVLSVPARSILSGKHRKPTSPWFYDKKTLDFQIILMAKLEMFLASTISQAHVSGLSDLWSLYAHTPYVMHILYVDCWHRGWKICVISIHFHIFCQFFLDPKNYCWPMYHWWKLINVPLLLIGNVWNVLRTLIIVLNRQPRL